MGSAVTEKRAGRETGRTDLFNGWFHYVIYLFFVVIVILKCYLVIPASYFFNVFCCRDAILNLRFAVDALSGTARCMFAFAPGRGGAPASSKDDGRSSQLLTVCRILLCSLTVLLLLVYNRVCSAIPFVGVIIVHIFSSIISSTVLRSCIMCLNNPFLRHDARKVHTPTLSTEAELQPSCTTNVFNCSKVHFLPLISRQYSRIVRNMI